MSIFYSENISARTALPASGITDSSVLFDILSSGNERSLSLSELKKTGPGIVNVKQYGAVGNGTTDDTTAVQAAINTGLTVVGTPGETYIISSVTLSTSGQHVQNIKLKRKASTSGTCIIVNSDNAYLSLEFDGNSSNQTFATDGDRWNYYGIRIAGDNCQVKDCVISNEGGLGIAATSGTKHSIIGNIITGAGKAGIYISDTVTNLENISIVNNRVETSHIACLGIAIYGNNDISTSRARRCLVNNNILEGLLTGNSGSQSAAINLRATDSVVDGNSVYGFALGITCDATNSTSCCGNRIQSETLGIEMLGRANTIMGNVISSGTTGISISQGNDPTLEVNDRNVITGNVISNFSSSAIYILADTTLTTWASGQIVTTDTKRRYQGNVYIATSGGTTNGTPPTHLEGSTSDGTIPWTYLYTTGGQNVIANNQIDASRTTVGINVAGQGCRSTLICGNSIIGPGKSTSNSRAIILDSVERGVVINSNYIQGFQRSVQVYSATSIAWEDIHAVGNSAALDAIAPQLFLSLEGSASWSDGCVSAWNNCGYGIYNLWNCWDLANTRVMMGSQFAANPSGAITAGTGSLFINQAGGASTTLYVKEAGSGNTGWVAK